MLIEGYHTREKMKKESDKYWKVSLGLIKKIVDSVQSSS